MQKTVLIIPPAFSITFHGNNSDENHNPIIPRKKHILINELFFFFNTLIIYSNKQYITIIIPSVYLVSKIVPLFILPTTDIFIPKISLSDSILPDVSYAFSAYTLNESVVDI